MGWFFGEKLIMGMLSGAPRRFLNFCLGAEILGLNMLISGPFRKGGNMEKCPSFSLVSQLQGRNSKIASVPRKAISWGVARQKISSFDTGVWAVGGVLAILMDAHLLFRALLYIVFHNHNHESFQPSSATISGISGIFDVRITNWSTDGRASP